MTAMGLDREYTRSVANALGLADPRDAVERVKDVVISELQSLDRTVHIRATSYFNHTFVPDLVLTWPRDSGLSREVFLRFTSDLDYLADGIRMLDSNSPMVVGLGEIASTGSEQLNLESAIDEKSGLVLDPGGIGALASANSESPVNALMSNALAQGGLGVLDATHARTITDVVAEGFSAARSLHAGITGDAARLLEEVLNSRGAARMVSFLQAVWIGSGGRFDLFPGRPNLEVSLADQTLEFLLRFDEINDEEFWSRLGRDVSLEQLSRMTFVDYSANLQHLVNANLDHLWCRGCVVSSEQPLLDGSPANLAWYVERGFLRLRGGGFFAGFTEQAENARQFGETQRTDGLSIEELKERSRDAVLESLTMSDRANQMVFGSESHADVAQSERLRDLAETFGAGARVQQAVAALPSGQRLSLDLRLGVATGLTKSRPLVAEVGRVSIPLFANLDDVERTALSDFLDVPSHAQQELELEFEGDE